MILRVSNRLKYGKEKDKTIKTKQTENGFHYL